jgi:hypothetical protein
VAEIGEAATDGLPVEKAVATGMDKGKGSPFFIAAPGKQNGASGGLSA